MRGRAKGADMAQEQLIDAFDDLKKLADQMEQDFFELVRGRMKAPSPGGKWKPLMDIYELEGQIVVKMEVPGIRKEDITIIQNGNRITISGTRGLEDREQIHTYHQMEINYGEFERTVLVSDEFTLEDVAAEYREGFLLIRAVKKPSRHVLCITER